MGAAEDDATPGLSVERAIEQYPDASAGNSRKNIQSALARWRPGLKTNRA